MQLSIRQKVIFRIARESLMGKRRSKSALWVSKAIKLGIIHHHSFCACVDCGRPAECYDHRDYTMPHIIVPVCARCDSKRGEAKPALKEYFTEDEILAGFKKIKIYDHKKRSSIVISECEFNELSKKFLEYLDVPRYKVRADVRVE